MDKLLAQHMMQVLVKLHSPHLTPATEHSTRHSRHKANLGLSSRCWKELQYRLKKMNGDQLGLLVEVRE